MSSAYDLGDVLPGEELATVPAGTSLLLSGPSMVGKSELAIRMLGTGNDADDGILLVTTQTNAGKIFQEFEQLFPTVDTDRIGLIDCSGSQDRDKIRAITTERVGSPGDLTGISIGAAKLMQTFADRDIGDVRHGLVSVSTLLQYLDPETVFKFLHIYTNRVESTDGLAVFTIDSDSHDEQTVNTMTGEFDGVVSIREAEDGALEYQIRGLGTTPTKWAPLE